MPTIPAIKKERRKERRDHQVLLGPNAMKRIREYERRVGYRISVNHFADEAVNYLLALRGIPPAHPLSGPDVQ